MKKFQKGLLYCANWPKPNKSWLGFYGRKFVAKIFYKVSNNIISPKKKYKSSHNDKPIDSKYSNLLIERGFFFIRPEETDTNILDSIKFKLKSIEQGENINTSYNKKFMYDLLRSLPSKKLVDISEDILKLSFIQSINQYLGEKSRIVSIKLLRSPPSASNSNYTNSQLFHFDDQSERMIKIIIPLTSISTSSGPFTFIPALESTNFAKKINYGFPFKDSNISMRIEQKYKLKSHSLEFLSSNPPSWLCIDTSRCLHMGSRNVLRERNLLMISLNGGLRTTLLPEPISIPIN